MNLQFLKPSVVPVALDQAGLTWFNILKNQYQSAVAVEDKSNPLQAKAKEEVDKILTKSAEMLTTQDVFTLEDWLLALLPLEQLKTRVNSLRDEFQEVFGDTGWEKILPELVPKVPEADIANLIAEARRLQEDLHWQSSIRPWAQKMRQHLMGGILFVLVSMLLIAFIIGSLKGWSLAGVLLIVGMLGGTVSSIQRIQGADLANSRAMMLARHDGLFLGVIISPVLGGIFALVLSLILMGGAVTPGLVIPNMTLNRSAKIPEKLDSNHGAANASLTIASAPNQEVSPSTKPIAEPNTTYGSEAVSNRPASQTAETESCQFDFFGLPLRAMTSWHWSKSFFVIIGSWMPS